MTNTENESRVPIPAKTRIASCILKCIVILSAAVGTCLSAIAGGKAFMSGSRVFMYFTIQSNIAIALICTAGMALLAGGRQIGRVWMTVKFMGTIAITLTGLVFCFVLAPTLGPNAWTLYNVLTHVVVPVAAIADFFVTGVYGELPMRRLPWCLLPPLAYAVYAGIGYAAGWEFSEGIHYPYFFLNWGSPLGAFGFGRELPFMGCAWWILALFMLLLIVGWIYISILNRIRRNIRQKA